MGVHLPFTKLQKEVPLPCIAHWNQQHFVVVYKISDDKVWIADPGEGLVTYTIEEFLKHWNQSSDPNHLGVLLLLQPTPQFYKKEGEENSFKGIKHLLPYITGYRALFFQIFSGLCLGLCLQAAMPFLTQALIDYGVEYKDLDFIYLILMAQTMIFVSRIGLTFIRGWILLHIGTRITISLITDFLIKLLKLPMAYFDTKLEGDILQRISDHYRIESFLTSSTLSIIFSIFHLIIYSCILLWYNIQIFFIYLVCSIFHFIWVFIFLKKRRELDFKRFGLQGKSKDHIIQMIKGIPEIRVNNCDRQKRWAWESNQAELYKVSVSSLALEQYQSGGGMFINEFKNIIVTIIAATSVVEGEITLGIMMSISYILGQLQAPVEQLISFIRSYQDAKISLERLSEIHDQADEEPADQVLQNIQNEEKGLSFENVNFSYEGALETLVLNNVSLTIPHGKVTAIVGMSGSGKTTLLKLLLKFYKPRSGKILTGETNLDTVSHRLWRERCGVVLQDGYIFTDTIANNVALGDHEMNEERLKYSLEMANLKSFVESLPLAYNTKIGGDGHGLSQGQKQRILMARAIYKNPDYLFLDEATNALDANNEKKIVDNLSEFFNKKTVIIVAHRLSTVKHADQIIVLRQGQLIESGTHESLVKKRGAYFSLVQDQLELES